jgi:cytochrome c-type biogenesis protein CcmH
MMWLLMALLALLAFLMVAAGALNKPSPEAGEVGESAVNRALYREKQAELRRQLAAGDIDEDQYEELEIEYQRQFLVDSESHEQPVERHKGGRVPLVACAVAVPLLAMVVYHYLGAADALSVRQLLERRAALLAGDTRPGERLDDITRELRESLADQARDNPDRAVYPLLLARLNQESGDLESALAHYREAVDRAPEDGELLAEYAQALFLAENNTMTPRVRSLAGRALALAPGSDTALGLAGIGAYQAEDYRQAIQYWQRALESLPPMSTAGQSFRAGIASAREKLGEDAGPGPVSLEVAVTLADRVEAPPDTPVFVYARAWQGSPMPLAIRRLTLADLPARVTLDGSSAMSPGASLSSVDQVELVARVALGGTATPASGDYEGRLGPVAVAEAGDPLQLTVDRRLP